MLCRCEKHGWPDGTRNKYVAKVEPAGEQNESILCGLCEETGAIFLNEDEYADYEAGTRAFTLKQADVLQIRLSDSPEEIIEIDSASNTDW